MVDIPKVPTEGSLYKQKRRNTTTSQDLLNLATENGYGEEANALMNAQGEKANEFFSGGFISDVFDALNVLQYGIVGLAKGQSFAEGIKTRASFSDKEFMGEDAGLGRTIFGTLLDIAVDPLTYIGPWTALKKIPGITEVGTAAGKWATKSKAVQKTIRGLSWMGGQDKWLKQGAEQLGADIAGGAQKAGRLLKPLTKIDTATDAVLHAARTSGDWSKVAPDVLAKAAPAFQEVDKLSLQLVKQGQLPREVYEETVGKYLPRLFEVFENPTSKAVNNFGRSMAISKQAMNRTLKRADLADDVLLAMEEITTAGYPTAKALFQMNELAAKGKFYQTIGRNSGLAFDTQKFQKGARASGEKFTSKALAEATAKVAPEGFVRMPSGNKWGRLSGEYVQPKVAEYLTELEKVSDPTVWKKVVAGFKFGKVIMNPATHVRNIFSNFILNSMEGMSLVNPRTYMNYAKAAKQVKKKGIWFQALTEKYGKGVDGYASAEVMNNFATREALGAMGKGRGLVKKALKPMADAYQGEELWGKTAAFMHHSQNLGAKTIKDLDKLADPKLLNKMGIARKFLGEPVTVGEAASRIAERATFNYAQVGPWVKTIRDSMFGMPFITFTAKSTPQIAKTIAKHPGRISWIGKTKNAIEKMSGLEETNRERASEPQWIKDGFYIKLPMKDKHGRSAYFDLTYIIPFGDLASGQFFERQIDRETGMPESIAEGMLKKAPLINLITEIGKNQDFYGNKIWKDSDGSAKQGLDLFRHIAKSYLPPLAGEAIPGGTIAKGRKAGQRRPGIAKRTQEAGEDSQYRTASQELLRNLGMKVQPINVQLQEQYAEWGRKKTLESFLTDKGVLGKFERTFKK